MVHIKIFNKKRQPSVLLGHHQQPQSPNPHSPLKVVLFQLGADNFANLVVLLPRIRLPSFLCFPPSSLKDTYLSPPPPRVSLDKPIIAKTKARKGDCFQTTKLSGLLSRTHTFLVSLWNRRENQRKTNPPNMSIIIHASTDTTSEGPCPHLC